MVAYVVEHHYISISRACRVASLSKSMYYYQKVKDDSETIAKLQELSLAYTTEGQDLYYGRIRTQGYKWNYKRVRRVYLLLGLNQRRKDVVEIAFLNKDFLGDGFGVGTLFTFGEGREPLGNGVIEKLYQ